MALSSKRHGYYGMIMKEWWLIPGLMGIEGQGRPCPKDKIESCGSKLQAWGSLKTRPDVDEIKILQTLMENINKGEPSEESRAYFLEASKLLDELLLK